jgi:hypothetical protein
MRRWKRPKRFLGALIKVRPVADVTDERRIPRNALALRRAVRLGDIPVGALGGGEDRFYKGVRQSGFAFSPALSPASR